MENMRKYQKVEMLKGDWEKAYRTMPVFVRDDYSYWVYNVRTGFRTILQRWAYKGQDGAIWKPDDFFVWDEERLGEISGLLYKPFCSYGKIYPLVAKFTCGYMQQVDKGYDFTMADPTSDFSEFNTILFEFSWDLTKGVDGSCWKWMMLQAFGEYSVCYQHCFVPKECLEQKVPEGGIWCFGVYRNALSKSELFTQEFYRIMHEQLTPEG